MRLSIVCIFLAQGTFACGHSTFNGGSGSGTTAPVTSPSGESVGAPSRDETSDTITPRRSPGGSSVSTAPEPTDPHLCPPFAGGLDSLQGGSSAKHAEDSSEHGQATADAVAEGERTGTFADVQVKEGQSGTEVRSVACAVAVSGQGQASAGGSTLSNAQTGDLDPH